MNCIDGRVGSIFGSPPATLVASSLLTPSFVLARLTTGLAVLGGDLLHASVGKKKWIFLVL
jgi:hypothetical protein